MLQGDHSIAKSLSKGEISQEEADQITEITQSLENHPEVAKYYQRPHTILDERDLLLPHQGLLRPDRLVMTEDRKIVVIDYKTGEAKKAHVAQLNDYGDALIQAGYAIESKVLIYLSTKVEEVISW
jgi:predicted Ser/Thr protein kinase